MKPEIYAYKSRSGGKRGTSNSPVEADAAAVYDPDDGVSDLLGVSENRGGTTPASKLGNMGSTSASRQANSQPSSLRHITADRPIFTLSVAADLLGLHPRTLRIYEEKGLVVPARTHGNRRRYSQLDIERFQAIRLLTQGGVNLEGVRIILDMAQELSRLGSDPTAIIERNLQTSG